MAISAHLTPQTTPRNFSAADAAGLALPLLPGFFLQSTLLRSLTPTGLPSPHPPTGLGLWTAIVISAWMPYLTNTHLAISTLLLLNIPTTFVIHG
ncbi:hypothetical protein F4604DRAFT_1928809 [Suillus subluteus]|nr:hypothetical protein F4604DRAFT_1928809 [Suillus subluteus]